MKLLDLTQDFRGLVKHIPLNPRTDTYDDLDPRSRSLIRKTIDFFEKRGKHQLKEDDHNRTWYQDLLDFQAKEKLFATFLTPSEYGAKDARWDTYRNCALNEVLGFYGLAYWYTWQVSILGLGPIWISDNETVKKRAAKLLKEGGIFAFGLSEKEHGADVYATDMILSPQEDGSFRANGGKYYNKDFDFLLNLGELFTLVVYGQQITRRMMQRPAVDHERQQHVWENYAYAQRDQYEMKD